MDETGYAKQQIISFSNRHARMFVHQRPVDSVLLVIDESFSDKQKQLIHYFLNRDDAILTLCQGEKLYVTLYHISWTTWFHGSGELAGLQPPPRITNSVTSVTNCKEGHVISGSVTTSVKDVQIVARTKVGCNAIGQCSAYQVTAKRDNGQPFDIDVSVVCTEDGLDTEFDRAMEWRGKAEEAETPSGVDE